MVGFRTLTGEPLVLPDLNLSNLNSPSGFRMENSNMPSISSGFRPGAGITGSISGLFDGIDTSIFDNYTPSYIPPPPPLSSRPPPSPPEGLLGAGGGGGGGGI